MLKMGDYYTENPSKLQGQPKRTIADYVEQNGILVPRRFESLGEARRSKKGILLRSEHEQDYAGVSGLLESFPLSYHHANRGSLYRGVGSIEEVIEIYFGFEDEYIKKEESNWATYAEYCELLGIPQEEFKAKVSFSLWEHLGGYNRTVVADSSVPNRWHIFTKDDFLLNYSVYDKELGLQDFSPKFWRLTSDLVEGIPSLIRDYERIRHLDRFDVNHCPIIELQTVEDKNYFLQYYRMRDFEPASFVLDREPIDGEIEVSFMRGATKTSEGETFHTLWRAWKSKRTLTEVPESLLAVFGSCFKNKITTATRKLHVTDNATLWGGIQGIANGHDDRGDMFKPYLFLMLVGNEFYSIDPGRFPEPRREDKYIDLHVVADGRRAFVKRI
jgi:hypothetical protein